MGEQEVTVYSAMEYRIEIFVVVIILRMDRCSCYGTMCLSHALPILVNPLISLKALLLHLSLRPVGIRMYVGPIRRSIARLTSFVIMDAVDMPTPNRSAMV